MRHSGSEVEGDLTELAGPAIKEVTGDGTTMGRARKRLAVILAVGAFAALSGGASSCDQYGDGSGGRSGGFCSSHDCIGNYGNGNGSRVQCEDGTYSHSGGIQGACSYHGGVR